MGKIEMPFSNQQVLTQVLSKVNSLSAKEKKRNPAFVEQLLALKAEDLSFTPHSYAYKKGKFLIKCDVRADYSVYGENHQTSVVPMEFESVEIAYPVRRATAGYRTPDEQYIGLAAKLLGVKVCPVWSINNSVSGHYVDRGENFDSLNWERCAVQGVAESIAWDECKKANAGLGYCKVTDYVFQPTSDVYDIQFWGIGATLKDEKGKDVQLFLGYVLPKDENCQSFHIEPSIELPLNAKNAGKEKAGNIIPLVFVAVAVILAIIFGKRAEMLYGLAGGSAILYFVPFALNKGPGTTKVLRILSVVLALVVIAICLLPLIGGGGQAEGTPTALLFISNLLR